MSGLGFVRGAVATAKAPLIEQLLVASKEKLLERILKAAVKALFKLYLA
jgi:hypothetical protein